MGSPSKSTVKKFCEDKGRGCGEKMIMWALQTRSQVLPSCDLQSCREEGDTTRLFWAWVWNGRRWATPKDDRALDGLCCVSAHLTFPFPQESSAKTPSVQGELFLSHPSLPELFNCMCLICSWSERKRVLPELAHRCARQKHRGKTFTRIIRQRISSQLVHDYTVLVFSLPREQIYLTQKSRHAVKDEWYKVKNIL